jgi:ABC-2 type transport system ATP-binding protein
MISIHDLSVSFPGTKVFGGVSKNFGSGEVHGIVGLNGSGKTTFFNVLSGSIRVDSGNITWNGQPVSYKDISFLETVNYFYSRITGNEYLGIFTQNNPRFDLPSLQNFLKLPLDELIENYSTGMKKKLALLGVLKQDKPILLLDEPFNGLDLESNKLLEIVIQTWKEKGKTIFLSSHIIDPMLHTCDQIHLLEKGAFTRSFRKEEYAQLEDVLFGALKAEAAAVIKKAI